MTKKSVNQLSSILVIVCGFIVVYLVTHLTWSLFVALAVALIGVLSDRLTNIVFVAWMKLSSLLGFIVPKLLLTVIFCVVLLPLSFFSRLFKRNDPLKLASKHASTFVIVMRKFEKDSFEKMW